MKLEEQVLTIEQMNHLKELGVVLNPKTDWVKDTAFYYEMTVGEFSGKKDRPVLYRTDDFAVRCKNGADYVPTLTLQEILEMLPKYVVRNNLQYFFRMLSSRRMLYINSVSGYVIYDSINNNVICTAYNMLCWCAENGYLNKE